ncbi:hypothetical protein CC86DRAFT_54241 [Ophiobolus disseminans]|uniref:Uncharacterized protein n=1 Tax=Ophiobolus disseminans TaxID=1469910 RepID=A0A6A6ZVG2_9PLEO|nr:hypothetical protein CC86DRAFT_54241 [Ophiobolus disseminans]
MTRPASFTTLLTIRKGRIPIFRTSKLKHRRIDPDATSSGNQLSLLSLTFLLFIGRCLQLHITPRRQRPQTLLTLPSCARCLVAPSKTMTSAVSNSAPPEVYQVGAPCTGRLIAHVLCGLQAVMQG